MEATSFRLRDFGAKGIIGAVIKLLGPMGDRLLGLDKLDALFRRHDLAHLDTDGFLREVLSILNVEPVYEKDELDAVPKEGPLIVVSNHPYGGVEGIILARLLRSIRPDVKVLANSMLRLIVELRKLFIFIRPLSKNHPENAGSLRRSLEWVEQGHALVLFPAGRVSFFRKDLRIVTDGPWNRVAASFARLSGAPVVPVHFSDHNSALFQTMGRIYYRFRLLMLPREFLKSGGKRIGVRIGRPIRLNHPARTGDEAATGYLRMRTYLLASNHGLSVATPSIEPLISPVPPGKLVEEIEALPDKQRLIDLKGFMVYYGYQAQMPETVREIGRLRELTFRELNEGSGKSCDIDGYDETYIHLFVWDGEARQIVGAYRMGQVDRLTGTNGAHPLYLSRMFRFSDPFMHQISNGLEMGRSWIRREHQRSYHGLFLLWRGIGEYVLRHPHYHTLYGTASLSTTYHPYSLALMSRSLVEDSGEVEPIYPFEPTLHPEVDRYLDSHTLSTGELSDLVRSVERYDKDLPVLVKLYLKIGARFHSVAIDRSFNNTPGALLSVDLRRAPEKTGKMFLGEGFSGYLQHHGAASY